MSKWLTTNPPTPLPWGNDPKQSKSEFLQILLEDGTETLGFFGLTDSDKRWVVKEHWFTMDSENPVHTVVGWHSIPKWIKCSDRLPEVNVEHDTSSTGNPCSRALLLIAANGSTCQGYRFIDDKGQGQGVSCWVTDCHSIGFTPVAWMEIPEYEP